MSSQTNMIESIAVVADKKRKTSDDGTSVGSENRKEKKPRQTLRNRFPEVRVHRRTPYQFYLKEKAKENRDNNGSPKNASVYSKQWNIETDRSRWMEMAAQDELRFVEEVRSHGYTYNPKKIEHKPKKPCAPFLLYARSEFKELQNTLGVSYKEALKILGARWKGDIDPDIKNKYIEIAAKEKERFDAEKAAEQATAEATAEEEKTADEQE